MLECMSSEAPERSLPLLTTAPASLEGWAQLFDPAHLPVLGRTAFEVEDWRLNEDRADAHLLSEFVSRDPLMTLKLFDHLARMRPGREDSIPETVTGCLLMLGIPPFFSQFTQLVTVEEHLEAQPSALQGLMAVLERSRRAADFALGFAVHRMDHDAQLIYSATLLHDVAEMLAAVKFLRHLAAQPPLARLIDKELRPGPEVVTDEEIIADFRLRSGTVYHPSCTCRMGTDPATSVLDPALRVRGVAGLRVIDASSFPNLIAGNTNAPSILTGWLGAEKVLADAR